MLQPLAPTCSICVARFKLRVDNRQFSIHWIGGLAQSLVTGAPQAKVQEGLWNSKGHLI
jgi:hypothetical protein